MQLCHTSIMFLLWVLLCRHYCHSWFNQTLFAIDASLPTRQCPTIQPKHTAKNELLALYWQQCTVCVQSQIPAPKQRPSVSVSTALYRLCAELDCQLAELNYKEVWIFDFKTLHRWRCWSSMIVKRMVVIQCMLINFIKWPPLTENK